MWVIGGTGIGLPAAVLLNVCLNGMYTIKIGNAVAGLFDSDHWSDEDLMDMAKSIAQHLVPSVSDVVDLWDTLVEFKDSIKTAWNNRPQPA
jgi:hypothetical protein